VIGDFGLACQYLRERLNSRAPTALPLLTAPQPRQGVVLSFIAIWWARRPLAAMRAAIFPSLIPDPGFEMVERARLYSQIDESSSKMPWSRKGRDKQ